MVQDLPVFYHIPSIQIEWADSPRLQKSLAVYGKNISCPLDCEGSSIILNELM